MSTITKEWLQQKIAEMESVRDEIPFGLDEDDSNTLAALRIALASLEAEPVAYIGRIMLEDLTDGARSCGRVWPSLADKMSGEDRIPLFLAPPALVSESEPMKMFGIGSVFKPKILSGDEVDCDNCAHYQPNVCHGEGCPAAMLQGADRPQNEPQNIPENIPATHFKPVADLYGLTSPTGGETSFTFDAVEARDFIDGGWSCQEYVELGRFLEDVSGNSPVIPDGWVACSERMPDRGKKVLIRISCSDHFNNESGEYKGDGLWLGCWFDTYGKKGSAYQVAHWMPLPTAPQQEVKP